MRTLTMTLARATGYASCHATPAVAWGILRQRMEPVLATEQPMKNWWPFLYY
jgi:hypothetical protein